MSFNFYSHYEKIGCVKGHKNNSKTPKILPHCDSTPGFEIPESTLDIILWYTKDSERQQLFTTLCVDYVYTICDDKKLLVIG